MHQLPQWETERRDDIRKLNRETAKFSVGQFVDTAKSRFTDIAKIVAHLEAIRNDLIENVAMFVIKGEGDEGPQLQDQLEGPFDRYAVNVLAGRGAEAAAHPGERIARQFTGLLDAALEASSAILILPQRIARTAGPVMAIAGPDRGGIGAALEIAVALKESLIVVTGRGVELAANLVTLARERGVHLEQIADSSSTYDTAPFSSGTNERLRVVTRRQIPRDASRLFSMLRGVPLLGLVQWAEFFDKAIKGGAGSLTQKVQTGNKPVHAVDIVEQLEDGRPTQWLRQSRKGNNERLGDGPAMMKMCCRSFVFQDREQGPVAFRRQYARVRQGMQYPVQALRPAAKDLLENASW
jgi:hypothetical protein